MNTVRKTFLRRAAALAVAAGLAIGAVSGTAVAQPVTDVYAYAGSAPATGLTQKRVDVAQAPVTGRDAAIAQIQAGPAAFGLAYDRPIVAEAPSVGRGYAPSAGEGLIMEGLAAGR